MQIFDQVCLNRRLLQSWVSWSDFLFVCFLWSQNVCEQLIFNLIHWSYELLPFKAMKESFLNLEHNRTMVNVFVGYTLNVIKCNSTRRHSTCVTAFLCSQQRVCGTLWWCSEPKRHLLRKTNGGIYTLLWLLSHLFERTVVFPTVPERSLRLPAGSREMLR